MNIFAYDQWIFTGIHKQLLEYFDHNIATRTIRNIISDMIIEGFLDESLLIELNESGDKNNPLIKTITNKLDNYMDTDAYKSYASNIQLTQGTKDKLSQLKIDKNESYEDVILRLIS